MLFNRLFYFLGFWFISASMYAQFSGSVFFDDNTNGVLDKGEKTVSGAMVSDGLHVVPTNSKGEFSLKGWEKARFITLYVGNNFKTDQRYIKIYEDKKQYNFAVQPKEKKDTVTFVHISDTETFQSKDWLNNLKAYCKNEKPDFVVHTGDICYRSGLDFHAEHVNSEDVGVPMYYCLGNHDLIKGAYGEQHFEETLGPAWYAFEEGNTLFVITPMMSGDYKPGFTSEDIGTWMKNLVGAYPKLKPKYFFNHDILTNTDNFSFKLNKKDSVVLNNYNLKGWVYGHWHDNMYKTHGETGIASFCVSATSQGGIDHSPSSYRVYTIDEAGDYNSQIRYTFVNNVIKIVSPLQNTATVDANGSIPLLVNAYDSGSEVKNIRYAVFEGDTYNWNTALEPDIWQPMKMLSNWTWGANYTPKTASKKFQVIVKATLSSGVVLTDKADFTLNTTSSFTENNWFNLGGNPQHDAVYSFKHSGNYKLSWIANTGNTIYMGSPLIYKDKVLVNNYDLGDGDTGYISCFNAKTGTLLWRFKTHNAIKNQMVIVGNKVIGTDVEGLTIALDINTGNKQWETNLGYINTAGFVSGIVADKNYIYTGTGHALACLNAQDGAVVWKNNQWNGGMGTTPTMTLAEGVLVVSSNWNALYGHDAVTGKLLWKRADNGLRFRDGTLTYKQKKLWVAQDSSGVGMLRKLDLKTGKTLKRMPLAVNTRGTGAPVITDNHAFIPASNPGLVALNTVTNATDWIFKVNPALFHTPQYYSDKQQTIEASPVLVNNTLLFGAMDGYVYAVNKNHGNVTWKAYLGVPVLSSAAVTKSGFYIADFAGNLYYFENK